MHDQLGENHPAAHVPHRLFDDDAAEDRWRRRFTATRMSLPEPARDEPDHAVYLSNASGTFELITWDVATGRAIQATARASGTTLGVLSADGRSLWWFDDTDGDEFGYWRFQPFDAVAGGSETAAEIALPDVAPGYPAGVAVGRTLAIAAFSDDAGTRVHMARDGAVHTVYHHRTDGGLGGLSQDESIWVLSHSEHGDSRYPALRALSVPDGTVLAELDDTPGKGLAVLEFSPVSGDQRALVGHERHGRDELGIWDVTADEFTELEIDLPGDLDGSFYPDGRTLLIVHTHQGRSTMYRYDITAGTLDRVPAETGVISSALARRDGSIWYRHSSASEPWTLRVLAPPAAAERAGISHDDDADAGPFSTTLLAPPDGAPPGSEPVADLWVDGPGGPVHALLARTAGSDPVSDAAHSNSAAPTVFLVHGGPAAADEDSFDTLRATYLDAGMAVCQVNYRGSTGYGSAWRDALSTRVGHTELADIAAVQDYLVIHGLADPDRCAIAGHSWGGFVTLLALGTQPTRWAAGVAGVPVADYVAAYADEMEPMRAYDRSLFGGSPDEQPDAYADSSPLTRVDAVRTPVLVLAGANDPRCPIRQIGNYLRALARHRADYRVYRFDAGHGSMVVDERIRQTACEVDFVRQHLLN